MKLSQIFKNIPVDDFNKIKTSFDRTLLLENLSIIDDVFEELGISVSINSDHEEFLDERISETDLSTRAKRVLQENKVFKVGELVRLNKHEVSGLLGAGKTTQQDIHEWLIQNGLYYSHNSIKYPTTAHILLRFLETQLNHLKNNSFDLDAFWLEGAKLESYHNRRMIGKISGIITSRQKRQMCISNDSLIGFFEELIFTHKKQGLTSRSMRVFY